MSRVQLLSLNVVVLHFECVEIQNFEDALRVLRSLLYDLKILKFKFKFLRRIIQINVYNTINFIIVFIIKIKIIANGV